MRVNIKVSIPQNRTSSHVLLVLTFFPKKKKNLLNLDHKFKK